MTNVLHTGGVVWVHLTPGLYSSLYAMILLQGIVGICIFSLLANSRSHANLVYSSFLLEPPIYIVK